MSFAAEPWFVPDTTSLKDQLSQFLKRKAQMALVVDEYESPVPVEGAAQLGPAPKLPYRTNRAPPQISVS